MNEQQGKLSIPPEAAWGPTFDVGRATDAYIATIPAADREKSDAYYEGGYWIEAWGTLITVVLCVLLLRLRFAPRLRDLVAARGRDQGQGEEPDERAASQAPNAGAGAAEDRLFHGVFP